MSSKRKRQVESSERDSPTSTPAAVKKRKGRMTVKDKEKQHEEIAKGTWVSDFIRTRYNEEGYSILEHFFRLPSRRTDPEYYKVVTEPLDFSRILQKLKTEEYVTLEQYCKDVEKMIANAKLYYKEDSAERKDILLVESAFEEARTKAESGEPLKPIVFDEDGPSMSDDSDDERVSDDNLPVQIDELDAQDVIAGILEYTDEHGRTLCPPFRVLQTKEEFPSYYEKVKQPIDLKKIAKRARRNRYKRMEHLVADLTLLFKNAQEFAGPGTDIYQDAEELLKYMKEKADKVLSKGCHASRKNKVKRIIDQLLVQKAEEWGSSEFSEDSEEDEDTEQEKDPRWELYWKVRNAPNDKDPSHNLADPFLELPSKISYPDYFDETETPISLFMINKRLKRGEYESVEPLFKDLMLMYENACDYNMVNSDIYVAAKRLEYITSQAMKSLAPKFDQSIYEKRLKIPTPPKPKAVVPTPKAAPTPRGKVAKVKLENLDTDSDSRTPPPLVLGRKRSPKKSGNQSALRFNLKMTTPAATVFQPKEETDTLSGKLLYLFNVVYSYKIRGENTYWPAGAFVALPSMKEYPDYYEVIAHPLDMKTIRERIEENKYKNCNELVKEFKILFSNAKEYNEPDSKIYKDANDLQKMLEKAHEEVKKGIFKQLNMAEIPKLKFNSKRTPVKKAHRKPQNGNRVSISSSKLYDDDEDEDDYSMMNGKLTGHPSIKRKSQARSLDDVISGLPEATQNMWKLFQTIKEHRDEKGRLVSVAFMKLPSKEEMPAYYEVIKKPMDMQRVHQKLQAQTYHTLSDMVADLALMLSNACKYNESDSIIYKDAVSLQRVLLEAKQELSDDDLTPHVQCEIRTIFTAIFAAVFSKKDENDRCMSDSFVELPELLKAKGIPKDDWPFTFDQIKRNIDKSRYRRLDRLQKDFFDLFEKAREVTRVGSRLFNDSVELQKVFCEERNARCKSFIQSNAYIVSSRNVEEQVDREKSQRSHEEKDKEVGDKDDLETQMNLKADGETELPTIEYQNVLYTAPCYAYISRTDDKKLPNHIMRIQRIFKNENGDNAVSGLWVYRPNETMHLASRKFYTNEVFVTPFSDTVLVERLRGTCLVVAAATWRQNEIEGFPESDIYICESRYFGKNKYFIKLKNWPYASEDEKLEMTERERPASPEKRVSEFLKERKEEEDEDDNSASSTSDDDDERAKFTMVLDQPREEVVVKTENEDVDGNVYYQQLRCANGRVFSIGQFVLVFSPHKPLCDVKRIHKLWRDKEGVEWFSGGWFARPIDTVHDKGMMFWQKEVLAVNQPDKTHKVAEIQSRCSVMQPKDYVRHRPTDIAECDVYVCESTIHGSPHAPGGRSSIFPKPTPNLVQEDYGEHSDEAYMNMDYAKTFRKMRTYTLDRSIPDEEFFIFKQPITMDKEMSPLLKCGGAAPLDNLDELMEDDTDADSVVSKAEPTPSQTPAPPADGSLHTNQHQLQQGGSGLPLNTMHVNGDTQPLIRPMSKSKSGYILFSAEIRKRIMHENPDAGFGEVSKIVGIEWKKLSEDQKKQYDLRAEVIAAERAKIDAARLAQERVLAPGQQRIYQCRWSNCDSQFDQEGGLFEHIVQHHTSHIIVDSDQQFVCMWTSCLKNRKDGKPFPSLPRLHRHMKEKHLVNSMRPVYQNQIGKNFFKLVTTTGPNGETSTQLVNMPYGRQPGAPAPQQQMNGQQQQQQSYQQHIIVNQQGQQVQLVQQVNGHPQQYQNGQEQQQFVVRQVPQQVVYTQQTPSSSNAGQPQYQQGQQVVHQQQQQQQVLQQPPQAQQQLPPQPHIQDAGRAIVRGPQVEPVFIAPPNSVHARRVLHSEAYLKYIESMSSSREQRVGKWERSMGIKQRSNVNSGRLPLHWIKDLKNGRPAARDEEVAAALMKLKEQILETTCNVSLELPSNL